MSTPHGKTLTAGGLGVFLAVVLTAASAGAQDAIIQASGGVSDMLILGPIDAGGNTSPNGQCSLGGTLGTTDFLTNADGSVNETNILVEEGDEVEPDFFGAAGGVGVITPTVDPEVNPAINPDGDVGVLQVWRATADFDGTINYNSFDNIGDPVDDYIVYSLVYLENVTDSCISAILEVGSDDAVKVLFNGEQVHLNNICRGIGGAGAGDRVPVTLVPGVNVFLAAVVERGGGTGVRLIVRDADDLPLTDGTVEATLIPPGAYPDAPRARVTRSISPARAQPGGELTVTLTATDIPGASTVTETFPADWSVTDNAGGDVQGETIAFSLDADGEVTYSVQAPAGFCDRVEFSGVITGEAAGPCDELEVSGTSVSRCIPVPAGATVFDFDVTGPTLDTEIEDFFDLLGFAPTVSASTWRIDPNLQDPTNDTLALHNTSDGEQLENFFSRVAILTRSVFEAQDVEFTVDITWDDMGGDANDNAGAYVRFRGSSDVPLENEYYFVRLTGNDSGDVNVHRVKDGFEQNIGSGVSAITVSEGDTVALTVRAEEDEIWAFVEGEPVPGLDPLIDPDPILGCGQVGVGQNTNPAYFDNLTFVSLSEVDCPCSARRSLSTALVNPGDSVTVTINARNLPGATTIADTIPDGWTVTDAGGGDVQGNTVSFSLTADGEVSYVATSPEDDCGGTDFTGTLEGDDCAADIGGDSTVSCEPICEPPPDAPEAELVDAFAFMSAASPHVTLDCELASAPGEVYTKVIQVDGDQASIAYSEDLGFGYEFTFNDGVLSTDPDLPPVQNFGDNWAVYGPLDASPNNRGKFPDTCPEQLYDSFIGAKDFINNCDEFLVGSREDPCSTVIDPEGIVFRVDVPNGKYRFVAAVGDADNPHAHRILAEDGGFGPPTEIGDHVVLVHNYDQSQQTTGQVDMRLGEGVYARVGFDGKLPPMGDGVAPDPQFVNMDEEGFATNDCPSSPTLEVTEGYIRIHQLQGNSNNGPGADGGRDPNGGDMVLLEVWRVEDVGPPPEAFIRGDIDGDGLLNITDAIVFLGWRFLGDPPPPCLDAADVDDRGDHNITDAIFLLQFQFLGTAPPPDPGPTPGQPLSAGNCGTDPTADDFGCAESPSLCGG